MDILKGFTAMTSRGVVEFQSSCFSFFSYFQMLDVPFVLFLNFLFDLNGADAL